MARPWSRRFGAVLLVAVAILVAAAFVALLWRGAPSLDASRLRRLTPVQRETAIDAIRGRLLQLGAGLVIAGGLVVTGLTFRLSREGHVTDRYTKAIDQLGSEHLDVKLGAIYALERIMIDSARDHPTIVEVLAAYVREHAPHHASDRIARVTTDVQAALTVLGRRPSGRAERGRLDLQRTELPGADLTRADLTNAKLSEANLHGARLNGAKLTCAVLNYADLTAAGLFAAQLSNADLSNANLSGANLALANLTWARLDGARLSGADLAEANLARAVLVGAQLDGTQLKNAKLDRADLTGALLPPGFAPGGESTSAPPDS